MTQVPGHRAHNELNVTNRSQRYGHGKSLAITCLNHRTAIPLTGQHAQSLSFPGPFLPPYLFACD